MGTSPPGSSYNSIGKGMPLINGPVEFSFGSFGKTVRTKFTTAPNKLCRENDLILCVRGSTTGRMNIADFDACIGRGVAAIRAKEYQAWINWYVRFNRQKIYDLGTGSTFPNISSSALTDMEIPVPPLPEQRRIVGILDEAFDGIATAQANAELNLQNARALFESYLNGVFTRRGEGWVEKQLCDVCSITSSLVDPREEEYIDLTHVGAGNIESKTGMLSDLKTSREERLISGKFYFDDSMVLYSKIRPYLMKVARPDLDGLCSADMYPLAPFPKQITRDFLFFMLLSAPFTDYAIQGSARVGMPKVNRNHLFAYPVWLPPVEIQNVISSRVDLLMKETQRLESLYQRKLAALDELKKSLLHQAFSGQL